MDVIFSLFFRLFKNVFCLFHTTLYPTMGRTVSFPKPFARNILEHLPGWYTAVCRCLLSKPCFKNPHFCHTVNSRDPFGHVLFESRTATARLSQKENLQLLKSRGRDFRIKISHIHILLEAFVEFQIPCHLIQIGPLVYKKKVTSIFTLIIIKCFN